MPNEATLRARAFGGRLERVRVSDAGGVIRVYDPIGRCYTTCHSLSRRDLSRVRAALAKAEGKS